MPISSKPLLPMFNRYTDAEILTALEGVYSLATIHHLRGRQYPISAKLINTISSLMGDSPESLFGEDIVKEVTNGNTPR